MMKLSKEARFRIAVRSALIAGVTAGAQGVAFAQDTPAAAATPGAAPIELDTIEVTGSRLPQPNITATSQMSIINDEELDLQGTVRVESLLNNMPQVFAEFSSGDSNGALGTATVSLRGLGSHRTLVLIDGLRLMPGDPRQNPPAPDLNFIPAALVDNIEILSGGASAVYGSDAVAGVVNFKMKRDFEGFRLDAEYTVTDEGDGDTRDLTLVWGTNFAGGAGNVTAYAGYTRLEAVTQAERAFSECSITTPASGDRHNCAGSRVIAEGRILSYDRYYAPGGLDYYTLVNPDGSRSFIPDDNRTFNFAPFNYLQRPDERYTLGAFAHREINEHLRLFGDVMFMDDRTVAQIAPSGIFGQRVSIPCNSPFVGTTDPDGAGPAISQFDFLCGDVGLTAADSADVAFLKRTVEVGPRQDDLRHTDYRIVAGGSGNIINGLSWDLSVQRGEVIFSETYLNDLSVRRAQEALNNCVDAQTPNCVPLDLFQLGAITPEAGAFVRGFGFSNASVVEEVLLGTVTADLGRWGVKLPTTSSGIQMNVGFEHRNESVDFRTDLAFQEGDLAGQGGETPPVAGSYNVDEVFTELQVPLIEDVPGAYNLMFDAAYRKSSYSLAGEADSYKLGLQYAPLRDVSLRASFQRAIRAPAIQELFLPTSFGLFGYSDPCAGSNLFGNPQAPTLEQCLRTGVTAAQYQEGLDGPAVDSDPTVADGGIQDCNAGQCNARFGGNIALRPEESETTSFGLVFTPTFLKGFEMTVDYFEITIEDAINAAPGVTTTQCLLTGNPVFCGYINRGPTGRLSGTTAAGVNFVEAPLLNTSVFETSGVDTNIDYKIAIGSMGRLAFNYTATYLDRLELEVGTGSGVYDCAGLYGVTCGTPSPHYRHKFRTTWYSPIGLALSANWRYFGEASLDTATNDPNLTSAAGRANQIDRELVEKQYLDLSGLYNLPLSKQKIALRFGVENVGNSGPQVVSSNNPNPISSPPFGNANTFPNVYDTLGRVFFLGVQADF